MCMKGLTSPVWTIGMFQMVTGDSYQCMKRTKQSTAYDISLRHTSWTVSGCGFVTRYQNTSNLENHYVTVGTNHKQLVDESCCKLGTELVWMSGKLGTKLVWATLRQDKTKVRPSPSQGQVDQFEGWLLQKPIPYRMISNDNFRQEGIFDYWNDQLPGHGMWNESTLMSLETVPWLPWIRRR